MYDTNGSERNNVQSRSRLGRIWADISYAQQRSAELNRPWLRTRRRPNTPR